MYPLASERAWRNPTLPNRDFSRSLHPAPPMSVHAFRCLDDPSKSEKLTPMEQFQRQYGNKPRIFSKDKQWYYFETEAPSDQLTTVRSAVFQRPKHLFRPTGTFNRI
ncbi:hypothetical protein CROQUDRAFT_94180 [Cronartium quercuum f. sp. fusiforme G11]|uniref:Uncharacterized protein n=1 Tax=Cronartium quercuum f. sp. fusiforme G11 TaxID=708437 RepID=A0A9P6NFU6_9BASI|nr:hypothetical protein CROQUDRAFT_94180 [Cronartium quercuum f. sp. fusiforme G11]